MIIHLPKTIVKLKSVPSSIGEIMLEKFVVAEVDEIELRLDEYFRKIEGFRFWILFTLVKFQYNSPST